MGLLDRFKSSLRRFFNKPEVKPSAPQKAAAKGRPTYARLPQKRLTNRLPKGWGRLPAREQTSHFTARYPQALPRTYELCSYCQADYRRLNGRCFACGQLVKPPMPAGKKEAKQLRDFLASQAGVLKGAA